MSVADSCTGENFDYRIAIIVPLSSRNLQSGHLRDLPLWNTQILSIKSTWGSSKNIGFDWYFGFDVGDPLFDRPEAAKDFMQIFMSDLGVGTAASAGKARARLLKINSGFAVGAPSWAVGLLAQIAVRDGADFLYQINDDTEVLTPGWSDGLPKILQSMGYVGVTGPTDLNNGKIFTQSFVHRSHLKIFPRFFVKPFRNWWSDDFISKVYPDGHHRKAPYSVRHFPAKAASRLRAGSAVEKYNIQSPVLAAFSYQGVEGVEGVLKKFVHDSQPVIAREIALAEAKDYVTMGLQQCQKFQTNLKIIY